MSNNISYQCPTEFNIATQLKSCDEYKKELQESMDPLKYRFDIRPGPMCYMPGQAFQGLRMAAGRKPPPQLLDMELTLQSMPLREQDNRYVVKDIRNAKPPNMPAILSNRLVVPDCTEILSFQRTKIKKTDFPQFSHRMDKMGMYLTNYMRPGRDTRMEMKEAFKRYEKIKTGQSHIFGVGKFDKRPLIPSVDTTCTNADSDLDCMHVYGPDAQKVSSSNFVDPTLTWKDLASQQNSGVVGSLSRIGGLSTSPPPNVGNVSLETIKVAETINPNEPYTNLLKKEQQKNGCNARFYGYTPPC